MKRFLVFSVIAVALCITAVLIGSTGNGKKVCSEPSNKAVCAMSNAQATSSAACPAAAKSCELKTCEKACSKGEACLKKDTCEKHAACPKKDNCSKKTEQESLQKFIAY